MKYSFIKLVPALAVLASCSGAKVYQSNDAESLIANQKTNAYRANTKMLKKQLQQTMLV